MRTGFCVVGYGQLRQTVLRTGVPDGTASGSEPFGEPEKTGGANGLEGKCHVPIVFVHNELVGMLQAAGIVSVMLCREARIITGICGASVKS
jgi:hypothetical protein